MEQVPVWLGVIATILTLAAVLGAAVAVYRTSVYSTSLKESDANVARLRGEIGDYQRREAELVGEVALVKQESQSCKDRCAVLEDLITHRKDDDVIRAEIAEVKREIDEKVITLLTSIMTIVRNGPDHA